MRLLVSVSDVQEASAALAGGADLIDAKNPRAGALGPVSLDAFRAIGEAVAGARPLTAALGDAAEGRDVELAAREYARSGAALVKLGFSGTANPRRVESFLHAAVRGASAGGRRNSGVVAVAYADADRVAAIPAGELVGIAANAGATGVLLDTADKDGPGLRRLIAPRSLAEWVRKARGAGLFVALAGQLTAEDLDFVREAGADIIGMRGAACEGGRNGRVSAARVRLLRELCGPAEMCGPAKAGHDVQDRST